MPIPSGWTVSFSRARHPAGASVRLIAAVAAMPAEAARRRHIENALSARTVRHHPELIDRLVELRGSRPVDPGALSAQAVAGALYVGRLRQTRIRARTLVLQGGADTVVDPRNGRLLADRIPGARLVTFPELGHLLFWEDPDGFADAVTSFLLAGAEARPDPPAAPSGPARGTGPGRERPLAGLVGKALTAHRRTRQRVGHNAFSRHDVGDADRTHVRPSSPGVSRAGQDVPSAASRRIFVRP